MILGGNGWRSAAVLLTIGAAGIFSGCEVKSTPVVTPPSTPPTLTPPAAKVTANSDAEATAKADSAQSTEPVKSEPSKTTEATGSASC